MPSSAVFLLATAFVSLAAADRILVLVDNLNVRETHSIFFKGLTGQLLLFVLFAVGFLL